MTIAEQRYFTAVPAYLEDIAKELKRMNDLKERELALKSAEANS